MRTLINVARWETIISGRLLWRGHAMEAVPTSARFAGLIRSSDGTISPARIQLLVLTVLTALQYLLTTIRNPSHFPAIPAGLVMGIGGSQAHHTFSAKAWSMFWKKR